MWSIITGPKVTLIETMNNNLENIIKKVINKKVWNTVFQFLIQHLKNNKLSHGDINLFIVVQYSVCGSRQRHSSKITNDEMFNLNSQKVVNVDEKKSKY